MAKRKQINEETFNKIRDLLGYGLKQQQVADVIGCSAITVHRIKKSEAKSYAAWRAAVKAANKAEPKKVETVAPEQTTLEEIATLRVELEKDKVDTPHVTTPGNEIAESIRDLTAAVRELVEAWEGNQAKKRRIF